MTDVTERPYLSIGEVLALLLEEFPDVTISKIRFLESQGLIDPERTASGYRKFYDQDVERLRVILREQRENYLPLKVIRDRLESGQIDDSGSLTPPRGIRNVPMVEPGDDGTGELVVADTDSVLTSHHPASVVRPAATPQEVQAAPALSVVPAREVPAREVPAREVPSVGVPALDVRETFSQSELCSTAGITSKQLTELESFGLLAGKGSGSSAVYAASDVAIATAAAGFLQRGIEPRHLRAWKQAAEREAGLFEQLVLPLIRQRNPQSRQQAGDLLVELCGLGGDLRAALVHAALQQYLDG